MSSPKLDFRNMTVEEIHQRNQETDRKNGLMMGRVVFGPDRGPGVTNADIAQIFPEPKKPSKNDIAEREMHEIFANWLSMMFLPFVHSRMDMESTIRKGWPDFSVFSCGYSAMVEMKMPGKKTSKDQDECIADIRRSQTPVMVCYDVKDAIKFIRETFQIID